MVELTPIEQAVITAMKELGATKDTVIKTADDITKKSNRPKGLVTNTLVTLAQKGIIKRVAREKEAGYYIVSA
jgi:predicted transcriptional regulator